MLLYTTDLLYLFSVFLFLFGYHVATSTGENPCGSSISLGDLTEELELEPPLKRFNPYSVRHINNI